MNKEDIELSIVIPCLNEEGTLAIVINKSRNSIDRLGIEGEVIVVDNGSTDNSIEIAEKSGARVVKCSREGYGSALIYGFKNAFGKYLIMGDADDSYNFDEIDDFVKYLREDYDIVIGTRLKGKIEKGAMPFLHRYLGTPILTYLLNLLFKTGISDCNCGMRGLKKETFEKMSLMSLGMEFASEIIIKAGIMNLRVKEIPITLYVDKRKTPPHLRTWSDGWRHLRFILLYSPTYLFMAPGTILMILGIFLLIPLINSPVNILGKTFDYHFALLGSLIVILGYQIINMGIYAKAYAYSEELKKYDKFIRRFYKVFSLEKGIIIGLMLFFVGLFTDSIVFIEWMKSGFGPLSRASEVAFASTLIIIGVQTIFSSFFLSILYINKSITK